MVMSGEDRIDSCGFCHRRDILVEALAASLLVGIVRRLVHAEHLPLAVALQCILFEPLCSFCHIGTVVDDCHIYIIVLYGVIIPAVSTDQPV